MSLYHRVAAAIKEHPHIIAYRDTYKEHSGTTTARMSDFGLNKQDLKILERSGLAVRGYFPRNARKAKKIGLVKGEPKVIDYIKHDGFECRWILLKDREERK